MKYVKGLLFILIIANIAIASYLAYQDLTQTEGLCLTGGCTTVKNSDYSSVFGIKNSYLGLAAYSILLIIYILVYNKKIKYLYYLVPAVIGSLLAVVYLYLQFFVIRAVCSSCLATDVIAIIIAIVSIYDYHKQK